MSNQSLIPGSQAFGFHGWAYNDLEQRNTDLLPQFTVIVTFVPEKINETYTG